MGELGSCCLRVFKSLISNSTLYLFSGTVAKDPMYASGHSVAWRRDWRRALCPQADIVLRLRYPLVCGDEQEQERARCCISCARDAGALPVLARCHWDGSLVVSQW